MSGKFFAEGMKMNKYSTLIGISVTIAISVAIMSMFGANAQTYTETVGGPNSHERKYAAVRGWRVLSGSVKGRFVYCVAEKSDGGALLRLGYNDNQWQLSVPVTSRNDWQGQLEVDGKTRSISGGASGKWSIAWLGLEELGWLKNGNKMILDVARYSLDHSLSGSTAAILKVEECYANKGRKTQRVAAAPTQKPGRRIESDAYRTGKRCPRLGDIVSPTSNTPATLEFIDRIHTGRATVIYWLDFQGRPVDMGIFNNGSLKLNSSVGHSFIVKDFDGTCYGGVFTVRAGHNRFVVR